MPTPAVPTTMLDLTVELDTVVPLVLNRLGGWRDDCIGWVLAKLHERKRAVAEVYANGEPDIT